MNALKKLLGKKKADSKFKQAGPGHRLTDDTSKTTGSDGGAKSKAGGGHGPSQGSSGAGAAARSSSKPQGPSDEKKQAAMAAFARLEKSKSKTGQIDPNELLASRQLNFIREQARKEIEAEKKLREVEIEDRQVGLDRDTEAELERSKHYTMRAEKGENVDPASYAVTGVFFTCPIIGPEVLPKAEIEEMIKNFLYSQPREEIGVTSCLLIHSCNNGSVKIQNGVDTLCKYIDNLISNPDEPKFQKIRCSNKVYQEKVATLEGAPEFLEAVGFNKAMIKTEGSDVEEEYWVFATEESNDDLVARLTELRDTLKLTTPIKPELDRNLQVLMPAQVVQRRELPPEFYELTAEELKKEQRRRIQVAERELTLRTKEQREKEDLQPQKIYKYVVIRVRFPDGFTLQGTFRSTDKIEDLYVFVQENLGFDGLDFSLRKPGGERVSLLETTLADNRLPPASILNFKLEEEVEIPSDVSYLKTEVLSLVQQMQ